MTKQPIDFIFSPYRRQVLALLYLRPDERFHVRELERLTGISAGSLHRELKAMAESGLLVRASQGNQVLYQVDRRCSIFDELASIFRKTIGLGDVLANALSTLSEYIEFAFVFGSMAAGKQHAGSDLDICVLGSASLLDIVKTLGQVQGDLNRELNPVVMSVEKYAQSLAEKDRFAVRVFNEPKIFVMGDEDEFRKLAQDQAA